jgi:signal transduction histidine kinase
MEERFDEAAKPEAFYADFLAGVMKWRGCMDEPTKALFTGAERSAERVVGQLRMAVALGLGAVFAITVVAHAQRDDAVLAVQIAATTTTLVAYLVLGALSYQLAVPHRFRPWMPWAFVTGDAGFLLIYVGLNVFTTGVGGNFLASFPALWFAPLVLAFGALQYNPARLVYATALLAGGLVAIGAAGLQFDTLADASPAAVGRFFDAPPNIMRLAMLVAAGAILVTAAARTRSLLQSAIDETRRRANLTVELQLLERERTRLEQHLQQARRMETVGALASGIAHNFNNIIGAILGYAEMAEAQVAFDSRPARNLDEIRRAGERARDLVDKILTFGRRRDARRSSVSVQELIAEARSLLHASLPPRIELIVREAPEVTVVSGDPVQLQQVILNLCNNAAQAMDGAGRVEVDMDVHETSLARSLSHGDLAPGRYVGIAVSDSGSGMDEATLGRIFEPFFTTRSAGSGLGLATVREIVHEHGGAMNVCSTRGAGSRFEAWLPCITAIPSAQGENLSVLPLGDGQTVLVLDSEREQLLRDEELLAALGYEPVGFTRPDDALAACREAPERFDTLLVGHLVPAMSALKLAVALHEIAPDLPILLARVSAGAIGAKALAGTGISEVVCWPLVSTEVAAALKRRLAPPRFRGARGELARL